MIQHKIDCARMTRRGVQCTCGADTPRWAWGRILMLCLGVAVIAVWIVR